MTQILKWIEIQIQKEKMTNTVTKLFGARCPTSGRRVAPFSRSLLHSPPQTRLTQKNLKFTNTKIISP